VPSPSLHAAPAPSATTVATAAATRCTAARLGAGGAYDASR
jgi:hypothetical protein